MMVDVLMASLLAAILSVALMTLSTDAERLNTLGRQWVLAETQLVDLEGRHRLAFIQGRDFELPLGKLCETQHAPWIMEWCAANEAITPPGPWPSSVCIEQSHAGFEATWVGSTHCHDSGGLRRIRRWSLWPAADALEATL